MAEQPKRIYRPGEAAVYLGLSRSTIDRLEKGGALPPAIRLGSGPRSPKGWPQEQLDAYVSRLQGAEDGRR